MLQFNSTAESQTIFKAIQCLTRVFNLSNEDFLHLFNGITWFSIHVTKEELKLITSFHLSRFENEFAKLKSDDLSVYKKMLISDLYSAQDYDEKFKVLIRLFTQYKKDVDSILKQYEAELQEEQAEQMEVDEVEELLASMSHMVVDDSAIRSEIAKLEHVITNLLRFQLKLNPAECKNVKNALIMASGGVGYSLYGNKKNLEKQMEIVQSYLSSTLTPTLLGLNSAIEYHHTQFMFAQLQSSFGAYKGKKRMLRSSNEEKRSIKQKISENNMNPSSKRKGMEKVGKGQENQNKKKKG